MNTPKPNTKRSETSAKKDFLGHSIWLDEPAHLPSTEHLSSLAATMARTIQDNPDSLADFALKIWFAGRRRLLWAGFGHEAHKNEFDWNRAMGERIGGPVVRRFESTKKYPISRDAFLRVMLPQYKGRTADLARIGKEWIRHMLSAKGLRGYGIAIKNWDMTRAEVLALLRKQVFSTLFGIDHPAENPTADEVARIYGHWMPYRSLDHVSEAESFFDYWYKDWREHHVSEARSRAAKLSLAAKEAGKQFAAKRKLTKRL
jgi:hypothetical protein